MRIRALVLAALLAASPRVLAADTSRIDAAFHDGLTWALAQPGYGAGELWALSMLDDPAARARVEQAPVGDDPFEGLYRPGATTAPFPPEWSRLARDPVIRIALWMRVAAESPQHPAPRAIVDELVTSRTSDYVLTHQYLSLRMLSDRGCVRDDARVDPALARMLDDIEAEQRSDPFYSDLAAERVAVLLHGGRMPQEMSSWIAMLVDAQDAQHHWRVTPHRYRERPTDLHATLVTLWALDQYRHVAPE